MNLKKLKAKYPIDFKLEAKPQGNKTKVYLYGDILDETPINPWTGKQEEGDFITPKGVRDLVDPLDGELEIHINTYGGSVFASVAIANYLRSSGKKITVYVDGIAASGGSIIAMAGNTIKMYPNAMLMIHKAWGVVAGNADEIRKQAEKLDKIDLSLIGDYAERYNGTAEELSALIGAETWLTAEESVECGLADEIVTGEEETETEDHEDSVEESTEGPEEVIENKFNKGYEQIRNFVEAAFFNAKK